MTHVCWYYMTGNASGIWHTNHIPQTKHTQQLKITFQLNTLNIYL